MGILTDDMTRLNDEVNALRNARYEFIRDQHAFVHGLKESVASMQSALGAARADSAKDMRARLLAGREARAEALQGELSANEIRRAAEARRLQDGRMEFLDGLRGHVDALRAGVSQLRGEFAADMAGAHRAWAGSAMAGERKAKAPAPLRMEPRPKESAAVKMEAHGRKRPRGHSR